MSECWARRIDPDFPWEARVVFGVIQLLYCPLIVTVNILLVVSLYATKQSFRTTTNFLVACLSLSDCLIGAILMPFVAFHNLNFDSKLFCWTITISHTLRVFLGGTSLFMTVLLAFDRFLHMNPNYHRSPPRLAKYFKPPKIYFLAIAVCAILAGVAATFYLLTKSGREHLFYFAITVPTCLSLAAVLFIVLYVRGYLQLRSVVAANPIYWNREESDSFQPPEYLDKLFNTVLMILTAMCLSWAPNLVLKTLLAVFYRNKEHHTTSHAFAAFREVSFLLEYSNSFVNALIILYRNDKAKEWLVKLVYPCSEERNGEAAVEVAAPEAEVAEASKAATEKASEAFAQEAVVTATSEAAASGEASEAASKDASETATEKASEAFAPEAVVTATSEAAASGESSEAARGKVSEAASKDASETA